MPTGLKHHSTSHTVAGDPCLNLPNPSGRIMGLGLTQSLTKISTRIVSGAGGRTRSVGKDDNFANCEPTSHSPMGLQGLLQGRIYVFIRKLCSYPTGHICIGLHGLFQDSFTFLYVDYVRTAQETHLQGSTACYRYTKQTPWPLVRERAIPTE
jgi:hypothetical protein